MSAAMKRALRADHQVASKAVLLDTDFKEVSGGTLFSKEHTNEITNFITDGNIDVDTERGTRRTAELTLLNPSSEFTPATEDFKSEGPWVGLIYLNRLVRIYRGLYVADSPEYVPVGTFMIDKATVVAESNMSLVNLTMSDQWKRMAKSFADHDYNFAANSWYVDIIETLLNDAGGYSAAALAPMPVIDPLNSRDTADKKTSKILTLEAGSSRGDFLKELVTTWDIDMYYDAMGAFRTEDRKSATDKRSVWRFGTADDPNHDGLLVSVTREFSDDNLYNHVIVVGGTDKNLIRREKADVDPRSKTNIELIGDRVWLIKDDKLDTANKVQKALDRAWAVRFQLGEVIQAETISCPALEGDDVVTITDRALAKVDGDYRLRRFTVPLVSSRQDIQAANIIYEANL